MKKLFVLVALIFGFGGIMLGEGCFHDHINPVNKAGIVTRGANIRNVPCMLGSEVIATLRAGTKVRIIGETARTKVVLPDGKIGWIGNDFVASTVDQSGIPEYPTNHVVQSYCDTTDLLRCPTAVRPGVVPSFYYKETRSIPTPEPTTYSKPSTTTTTSYQSTIQLTDTYKNKLDGMVDNLIDKLDHKYSSTSMKITKIEHIIVALDVLKKSYPSISTLVGYIQTKIEEELAFLQLEDLLDV